MASQTTEHDPFVMLKNDLWLDDPEQQKIDAFIENAGPQGEFWADGPKDSRGEGAGLRTKTVVSVAGLALLVSGFALSRSDRELPEVTAKVSSAAESQHRIATPSIEDSMEVPDVQVAGVEKDVKDVVNLIAANKFAEDQRAVAELISAKQAEEAAEREAQLTQARQNTEVHSNSYPGDFLACVRNRESGGNYGVYNSGGSGAAGAYQFMPGTWNSIAASTGRGDLVGLDPAQASPADQDAMAQALYAQQGAAPWGGGC